MTRSLRKKVKFALNFYILYMLISDMIVLYTRTKLGLEIRVSADGIASLFLFYAILDKVIFETIIFGFLDSILKAAVNLKIGAGIGLKLINSKLGAMRA